MEKPRRGDRRVPARALGRSGHLEGKARRGLRAWAGFPADRQPRPLILLSSAAQSGAFPDGQTKLAFLNGWVEGAPGFPAQILEALRGQPRPGEGSPLLLESAVAGEREFATDRGRKGLPAWCVQAQGVTDPIWVLDPAASRQSWQPPDAEDLYWRGSKASLGSDGRTLTLSFTGAPEYYTSYPGATFLESGNAVAVIPVREEHVTGPRTTVGKRREVSATLARPLGNRVLLDEHGAPVMVTSM
jgi:hypothetical protein